MNFVRQLHLNVLRVLEHVGHRALVALGAKKKYSFNHKRCCIIIDERIKDATF
jgi:hypothetical protein